MFAKVAQRGFAASFQRSAYSDQPARRGGVAN
jgi:hypothetical protein